MSLPTPDQISMEVSKERTVSVQPWVAAQLSDLWKQMKTNIRQTIVQKDKQDRVRISQVKPASAHNPT
jgi:hypothetical protein